MPNDNHGRSQKLSTVEDALDRDNFMTAEEAKDLGLNRLCSRKRENNTQYLVIQLTTCYQVIHVL